ncbi:TetR/AcrR family transcriptional regulator [Mycobacterium sp. Aquia_213]|uniref:TetR/AcrR family transcriptional regulator n=1 Tax=Mycobacterium sp. Aquia_213 TaxID=2991728 RepID=UPI0022702933|nr:TetR/AcrR family transcriptional regulator [Mycobacterium sp. Aquia_213]WAC90143.1 TetR/AcrR family transcriptional regulator [Mycobacterium sp. Aquia_213]
MIPYGTFHSTVSARKRAMDLNVPQAEPVTENSRHAAGRVARRRDKLGPDPDVRRAILAVASQIVREQGVRGLNIAEVLGRCQLGTRAFYRHFESKDHLVSAVFMEAAVTETRRLRRKMRASATTIDAVAAWIDARLDVAFDNRIGSSLRQVSLEAQTLMFTSPELVQAAFGTMLKPLIEQLERGLGEGVFHDIDPPIDAEIVQGAVWACTQRQWATQDTLQADVRRRVLRACLRAMGASPDAVAEVLAARGDPQPGT